MKILEMANPVVFRDYLKVLETQFEATNLNFDEDGLRVLQMDPSHVSLTDLYLPDTSFDYYYVGGPLKVGVNLEEAGAALKKLSKNDSRIQIDLDPEKGRLAFTLFSDLTRRKTINTLEPLEDEVPTPKIIFKSKTRILLDALKRILDDFKGHQHVTIITTEDMILFSVESDVMNEETPLSRYNDNVLEHRVEEPSKARYPMEYLHAFVRAACKVSEVAVLEFSTDMPMRLDVELPMGHLKYWVAHAIEY